MGDEYEAIRLCVRGVPIGRLPASVKWLQPLLNERKIHVEAQVVDCPAQLDRMSSIAVRLRVSLCHAAFANEAEIRVSTDHGRTDRPLCSLLAAAGLQPVGERSDGGGGGEGDTATPGVEDSLAEEAATASENEVPDTGPDAAAAIAGDSMDVDGGEAAVSQLAEAQPAAETPLCEDALKAASPASTDAQVATSSGASDAQQAASPEAADAPPSEPAPTW